MRVCAFDLETDGLDFEKSRVTEFAWIVKDIGDPKFLRVRSEFIFDADYPPTLTPEIEELTKIKSTHFWGSMPLVDCISVFEADLSTYNVDALVGHYAHNFDRPFLVSKLKQQDKNYTAVLLENLPLIDTRDDIDYPKNFTSRSLRHVAAELGFLNPFSHSALFDVATCLRVLECFDVEKVFARSKEPWVILQALTKYEERELAKKRRFCWENLGDRVFSKCWVKRVKASEVDKEISEAPFTIKVLE